MRSLLIILFLSNLTCFGQQIECIESWSKFDLFHSPFDNGFKVFTDNSKEKDSKIYLEIITNELVKYDYLIKGIRLHLTNHSDSTLIMTLSYSDGILICQVLNEEERWIDIENPIPSSFCGNQIKYFDFRLNPNEYIKLVAPCYKGSKQVKMRYKLSLKGFKIYSNSFEGFINPKQLE